MFQTYCDRPPDTRREIEKPSGLLITSWFRRHVIMPLSERARIATGMTSVAPAE